MGGGGGGGVLSEVYRFGLKTDKAPPRAPRFSNEDDERIFRPLARSDLDDGRDNVDSDWRQRGG